MAAAQSRIHCYENGTTLAHESLVLNRNACNLRGDGRVALTSANGLNQSAALTANYFRELKRVGKAREAFVNGDVIISRAVKSLMHLFAASKRMKQ